MSVVEIGNFEYSTEHVIGSGYSSTVYRGVDTQTNYPAVFKVVDTLGQTAVEHQLLVNELKALQMMDHPYVIETYAVRKSGRHVFIICEWCENGDLMQEISSKGAYSENDALDILTFLASGLNHIHASGILHRDLKTPNILLKQDGTVRIADFGFCEFYLERTHGPAKFNVGSPLYMSPQAYQYTEYSTKSDTWALGVIFYQVLIGQTPFKGMTYNVMIQNIENGYLIGNLNVSEYSKHILYGLLDTNVKSRWDTNQLISVLNTRNAQYRQQNHPVEYPINPSFNQESSSSCCCC